MEGEDNFFKRFIIPRYTQVFLFLTSILVILGLIFEDYLRNSAINLFREEPTAFLFIGGFLLACFLMSVFYTFSNRVPGKIIKKIMLFFIVIVESFVGLISATYILNNSHGILLIFPAINLLSAVSLMASFRKRNLLISYNQEVLIDETCISDKKAKNHEIIIGLISVTLLFFINRYFGVFWAVNLSVCLGYAYKMNEFLTGLVWKVHNN